MNSFVRILQNLGPSRIMAVGAVMLGIIGFFVYLMGAASSPSMSLMFSQLEPAEAAKILDKLDAMGVPNEARGDGTQIYVPSERVARLRMDMAQEGLPSGGVGYEIFDKTDILSASGSMIDINRLRALEGELGKSIRSISGVSAARVHLVLPKRELFSRDRVEPSASIVLKMKGSARLSQSQVQAVQHLAASAVPGLSTDRIAIVDDKGTLLAKNHDSSSSGADNLMTQIEARMGLETKLSRNIESFLERSVGSGKIKAEVSAEMNFDHITINSEEYNPEGQVVRSTSNNGEDLSSSENGGSDQNVSVQNSLPQDQAQGGGGSKNNSTTKRNEENITYEISRTIKTHQKESGTVKSLSVAVLVDGTYTEKDGKSSYTPRPQEELDKIKTLVKTAIGFKEDRGDKVEVINMPFSNLDLGDMPEESKTSWIPKVDLTKIIQFLILAGVGLSVLMLLVRPILMKMIASNPSIAAAVAAEGLLPSSPELLTNAPGKQGGGSSSSVASSNSSGQEPSSSSSEDSMSYFSESVAQVIQGTDSIGEKIKPSSFKKVGEVIDKYPEDVVSLIRQWMYDEPWKQ